MLILGGGFGGVYAALQLDKTLARDPDVTVTVVNRENFFLFTPMPHEVAASDLDVTHIVNHPQVAAPRAVLRRGSRGHRPGGALARRGALLDYRPLPPIATLGMLVCYWSAQVLLIMYAVLLPWYMLPSKAERRPVRHATPSAQPSEA